MDPAPAPTYDAPATRSNKRKESGHVDSEEPIPRKRGPDRPRTKAESKEDVSKGVNNELLQKTKRTAQQILDANTQLSSYAEEAFRVGRNVLAIYNMLDDNTDDLIGAVEKEEHGDNVKNIIRKVQKTRYDTVINNITPLCTKMEELPALREPLLVQLAIDKKTADEVRDWALYKPGLEQNDVVSVERHDAVTEDRPSTPEENDDDYDDNEDIPATKFSILLERSAIFLGLELGCKNVLSN